MLLKLKDGAIENIKTDEEYHPGCPTCDYGSQYINEVEVILTKHTVYASFTKMYEYLLSSGDLMQIFLGNADAIQKMTESEFVEWLKDAFTQKVKEAYKYDFAELSFRVTERSK